MRLRNPAARERILSRLERFANREYQASVWNEADNRRPDPHDTFDEAVNDLFDDVDDPMTGVADVFYDIDEAIAVAAVLAQLDAVLEAIGEHGAFAQAESCGRWDEVVRTAESAAAKLRSSVD